MDTIVNAVKKLTPSGVLVVLVVTAAIALSSWLMVATVERFVEPGGAATKKTV